MRSQGRQLTERFLPVSVVPRINENYPKPTLCCTANRGNQISKF
jgi:hypothetical protein